MTKLRRGRSWWRLTASQRGGFVTYRRWGRVGVYARAPMSSVFTPANSGELGTAALAYDPANPGTNGDIRTWDVTRVTNFQYMLKSNIFNADIGAWDTSRVTMMK